MAKPAISYTGGRADEIVRPASAPLLGPADRGTMDSLGVPPTRARPRR